MANTGTAWTQEEMDLLYTTVGLTHEESYQLFLAKGMTRGFDGIKKKRTKLKLANNDKWTAAEIQILENNYKDLTDQELSAQFFPERLWYGIAAKRAKLGLLKEAQWSDAEIELLKTEYHKGVEHCMALFPQYTKGSIKWLAGNLGLSVNVSELRRKYTHKTDYFTELTLENCYVAGFIAADGSLRSRDHTLVISIHPQDRQILENFQQFFGYTGQIYDYDRFDNRSGMTGKNYPNSVLAIHGVRQWYEDLAKHFNIVPNKTKILQAPNLTSMEHKMAFVAGYTDGDGSIYASGGKIYYSVLGTESVIRFIKDVFDSIIPVPANGKGCGCLVNLKAKYSFPLHRYTLSGQRVITICQKIKELPLPLLERKWSKI